MNVVAIRAPLAKGLGQNHCPVWPTWPQRFRSEPDG